MRYVQVLCSTRNTPFSWMVRLLNFSPWSHEAIIDGDHVIEAVATARGRLLGCVRRVPLAEVLPTYSAYGIIAFPVQDYSAAIEYARAQVGKPYDWCAIAWQVYGRLTAAMPRLACFLSRIGMYHNWRDEKKWHCFDLVEAALCHGDGPTRRGGLVQRSTDHWDLQQGRIVQHMVKK